MQKSKIILIILLFTLYIQSYSQERTNNLLLWGMAGYSEMTTGAESLRSEGKLGAGIGVGYELNYRKLLFNTGVEVVNLNSHLLTENMDHRVSMIDHDIEMREYTGNFYFTSNRDKYRLINVNIPVMLGFDAGKVYFLAGGKLGFNISGKSKTQSTVNATATYPEFIEDFGDMPNHFLSKKKETTDYKVNFTSSLLISGEIGLNLSDLNPRGLYNTPKTKWRLGVFFDYGLSNIREDVPAGEILVNKASDGGYRPVFNSYMLSGFTDGARSNTFFVGIKLTMKYNLRNDKLCHCWYY